MSAGAVICSACGYENIVVGCGFCLQCGSEFPASTEIKNELADESQNTQTQAATTAEATFPLAIPAAEALVATAAQVDSQCVGLFGCGVPEETESEEWGFGQPIRTGNAEVFQSALVAADGNDPFSVEVTNPHEEQIAAAIANDQPNDWQAAEPALPAGQESSAAQPGNVGGSSDADMEATEGYPAGGHSDVNGQSDNETAEPSVEVVQVAAEPTFDAIEVAESPATVTDEPDREIFEAANEPTDKGVEPLGESVEPEQMQVEWCSATAVEDEPIETEPEFAFDDDIATVVEQFDMEDSGSFSSALALELDRLVAAAAESIGMYLSSLEGDLVGELEINGRMQFVYVQRNCNADGVPFLSFFAACGPASKQHSLTLLEWNSALPMCAFAVRDIEDTQMFVVQANVPAFSLNQTTIAATFKEVARRAGQVQQRIG